MKTFLTERKQRVVVNGEYSDWVSVTSGVPQGTVTGPLWFLIFINDLPNNISSKIRLFADDCVIYRTIRGPSDADLLQQDLHKLTDWQNKWLMRFNEKKCYVMRIAQARSPLQFEYTLNGSQLQSTSCHGYLGVDISSDLKWNQHIFRTAAKANRALGFVRRNLKPCSRRIKNLAYVTLVRPILEYGSAIWDPYTQLLIDKLESVQRRAVRFIMNDYSRFHSVSDMMSELGIEPLSFRRRIARLTNFHKARGGSPCNPGSPAVTPGHPVLPSYQQEQLYPNISEKRLLSELLCATNNKRLELITRDYYRYHRNQALQRSNLPALPQINSTRIAHTKSYPFNPAFGALDSKPTRQDKTKHKEHWFIPGDAWYKRSSPQIQCLKCYPASPNDISLVNIEFAMKILIDFF